MPKEQYASDLRNGCLTTKYVDDGLRVFTKCGFSVEAIPSSIPIDKTLSRLSLHLVKGQKSWQGLIIGFPGTTRDLATVNVGTPFLRLLLYPIMSLFDELQKNDDGQLRCIYFMGARFPDVFLRKFNLIDTVVPRIVVLTNDLIKSVRDITQLPDTDESNKESFCQQSLCRAMADSSGLYIPTRSGKIPVGYVSHEVQTVEGTKNPERLDILGYDKDDGSLIAFEIKGPSCGRTQFENLFLQGLEHQRWIEKHKRAIKLVKEGPAGKSINTRKRTRFILGFCEQSVPSLFYRLRDAVEKKDRYTQIDFVNIAFIPPPNGVRCCLSASGGKAEKR